MWRLYEWHVVLAFGFLGGVATTLATQWVLTRARKYLRILAVVAAAASLQGCAIISPIAFGIRAAGVAASTTHSAWLAEKARREAAQPATRPIDNEEPRDE